MHSQINWTTMSKDLEQLVTWILIIGGWMFVRRDNNRREDRHELRSMIDSLTEDITSLEQKAIEYYVNDASDETGKEKVERLQMEILRDQDVLEFRIKHLKRTTGQFQTLDGPRLFRNAVTGGDFEESIRKKRPYTDAKLGSISLYSKALIEELEAEYVNIYRREKRNQK